MWLSWTLYCFQNIYISEIHSPAHIRPPPTIYLTVYECPYFCFFDLLIMIKLLRASWLEMAQRVESWLFCFTASHSGAEKKTTKWRVEEDRTRLKTSTSNKWKKKKCLKTAINLSFDHPNRYQMGFLPRSLEFPTWTKKERNENRWWKMQRRELRIKKQRKSFWEVSYINIK